MHRPSISLVPLLLAVACHGDGPSDPSSVSSAVTRPPLVVPTSTLLADTANVLAPPGDGVVSVDDRGRAHGHIPIWVPPGRAGIQPNLSLDYSSNGGNGMAGVGWGLSGLSRITRCPGLRKYGAIAAPIVWNDSDSFCLDGEPLKPDSDHLFYYKFHFDGSRLQYNGTSWEMRTKDGEIITLGGTTDSRLTTTPAPMTWAVSRIQDRAGNFMTVTWETPAGSELRPVRIDYTGSTAVPTTRRSVTFTYETTTRPDVDQRMVAGQLFTYSNRLKSIAMHAPNSANLDPLRTFSFGYAPTANTTTGRSLLKYIAECDGPAPSTLPVSGSTPLCRQQTFNYTAGIRVGAIGAFDGGTVTDANNTPISDIAQYGPQGVPPNIHLLDVDGDGRDDVLYMASDATYHLRLSQGSVFGPAILTGIPVATTSGLPQSLTGPSAPLVVDFNGDGHADVIVNQGETSPYYKPQVRLYLANNASGSWTLGGPGQEFQLFLPAPIYSDVQTADLNGDGRPDLVMSAGAMAYYAINSDGTVAGLSPVAPLPLQDNADFADSLTNYYLDFNNDGVTDLMTRRWGDDACRGQKIGQTAGAVLCDCNKIGFGAFDIDPHLYSGTVASQTTLVSGMQYCKAEDDGGDLPGYPTFGHLFGDFNGDGIVDVIETFTPHDTSGNALPMQLQLLLGGGNQSFTKAAGGAFTIANPNVVFEVLDADGDGKTDLLMRGYGGTAATPYTVWSYKSEQWQSAKLLNAESEISIADDEAAFATGDVDGDGQGDFVALDGSGYLALYTRSVNGRADLLQSTSGDFTAATTLHYQSYRIPAGEDRSDCTLPVNCVTRVGFVVSELDVDNGVGGTNAQFHAFAGGRSDSLGWGFLGFKKHTITDAATGQVTTRTFDFTRNTAGETPFFPLVGQPTEIDTTIVYQSGATNVTRTTTTSNQYEVRGLAGYMGPFMANPTSTRTQINDSNVSGSIDMQIISRIFDDYGDQTYERDQMPLVLEERNTTTSYFDDFTNWIISRPTDVATTSSTNVTITGGTSQTHETAYTYDALGQLAVQIDNPGAANGSSYDPLQPQTDGVQTLYTRYTRDANGLPHLVETLDDLNNPTQHRVTRYDRDTSEGIFVVQTTDPANLVTQAAYEPGLGVLAAQSDAANLLTTFQYDRFGRTRADHPAAGGGRTVIYHAATSGNAGTIDDHRAGQYTTTTALDSLRRTIERTTTGRADGKAVYVETTYDALGRMHTVSRSHFSGVTPAKTTTTYDNLGRVTNVQGADGSVKTTVYVGLTITTTNPDGNVSAVTNDTLGRPVTSVQSTTTGSGGLSGHVTTTGLTYGPFDTLTSSTDTLGNVVTSSYDRVARLLWKQDHDSGVTVHAYDVFGQLSAETRGARRMPVVFGGHLNWIIIGGTEMDYGYDGDGRVLAKTTPDMTQMFTYDSAMAGKLSNETITGGPTIAYAYVTSGNGIGNVKTKTWAGPRGAIGYAYTYDSYNRLVTTTYPLLSNKAKALVVRNTYNGGDLGGELTAVDDVTSSSTVNYWTLNSTDPSEAFPIATLRNGVQVTVAEDPSHPSWLYTIVGKKGTTTEQSLRYTHEGGGRVQKREDLVGAITETFGYDGLERLTSWTWNGAAGARGVSYIYDDLGNLQERNITAGPGTSVWYGYAGVGPHQPSSDALGTAYAYDEEGNQLVAPGRRFTWNSFARPVSVTAAAGTYELTYDADLARFSRTDPSGYTRYSYGPLFEELTDAAGTHDVMTITANGAPVGEKEITNNAVSSAKTNTLLTDALGSIDTIVTSTGRQAIKYDPFGARVTATDPTVLVTVAPQDLRAGFTGHDHDDDIDLIDMIGRVYDPQTQRFLAVDRPAPDPVDSQAYNPYAYVRNNPLNATDPTGYLEVTLDGLPWRSDNNPASLLQMGYAPGDTIVIHSDFSDRDRSYGYQLALVQGVNGTEGTGGAALLTPLSGGTLKIDTLGVMAPPADASKDLVVGYFRMVLAMESLSGEVLHPGAGWVTPAMVAGWTETLVNNNYCGSCNSAATLEVNMAIWANVDPNATIELWGFASYDPIFMAFNYEGHATGMLTWQGEETKLNWGVAESPVKLKQQLLDLRSPGGTVTEPWHKTVDEAYQGMINSSDFLGAPASCPSRGVLSNPYLWDPAVWTVRKAIGGP